MNNPLINAGSPSANAYLHHPGQSELRWMGETRTHFLATGESTAGAFCLVDECAVQGEEVPLHRHSEDVESFYVLEGDIAFYIGDQPATRVGAGGFVYIPAGTVHGFRIASETARFLILTTPHHGEFYRAITVPSQPGNQRPLQRDLDDTIRKACMDYGIEFVGPLPDV